MILIVTNKYDVTSDFVVQALRRLNAPFVRLNTEDLLSEWRVFWTPQSASIQSDSSHVRSADITSIYYRRPKTPNPIDGTSEASGPFVARESAAFLQNFLACVDAFWISPIAAIERSENKFVQLKKARELGFDTPCTLVTTDPLIAIDFLDAHSSIITKPITSGWLTSSPPSMAYTTEVDCLLREQVPRAVRLSPHFFQERLPKDADIRVTVVGDRCFACRIYSQDFPETEVDFRAHHAAEITLRHELFELPHSVAAQCTALVSSLGLSFGAIDLVEYGDKLTFLEVNPNGQWAWIQQTTQAPIAEAIAELLVSADHVH